MGRKGYYNEGLCIRPESWDYVLKPQIFAILMCSGELTHPKVIIFNKFNRRIKFTWRDITQRHHGAQMQDLIVLERILYIFSHLIPDEKGKLNDSSLSNGETGAQRVKVT